ncbi:MAG: Penicillin-insensitive murein endopeptidase [Candidatus Tokpelaia hoelldobleri]|uniref:Penicillin-insensitive murein endopeptidase n=1 Tax=Candidatus Tokpelaia hoelldobleri TaxID=1902579 RepID=A0A1U9JV24_9HYPH|nr:MAG: Penicillin-insensitive murein endopeptidase [Candidatus Tokpelaia hoelldoblerii]
MKTCTFLQPALIALSLASGLSLTGAQAVDKPAKQAFGAQKLPSDEAANIIGFYSKGCLAGAKALPFNGPRWQVMRTSRNRNWGHPQLIDFIEKLSAKAAKAGWPGLLVGDMSQPRGGPMLTGHASHQVGLDVDIWFSPMPEQILSYEQRENISAISMLKQDSLYIDPQKWSGSRTALLRLAAEDKRVERIFVHPGIKKQLCDTVQGERAWLGKVRPYWGHHYHFHVRLSCPKGTKTCRAQAPVPKGDGCDASLAWWLSPEPWTPKKGKTPAKKPRPLMVSDLPRACGAVLEASAIKTGGDR